MSLLHGPDADDDPAADPEHPRQLPQRPHAALGRRDVVDDGDRQRSVHALVAERQHEVITVENLQCEAVYYLDKGCFFTIIVKFKIGLKFQLLSKLMGFCILTSWSFSLAI